MVIFIKIKVKLISQPYLIVTRELVFIFIFIYLFYLNWNCINLKLLIKLWGLLLTYM